MFAFFLKVCDEQHSNECQGPIQNWQTFLQWHGIEPCPEWFNKFDYFDYGDNDDHFKDLFILINALFIALFLLLLHSRLFGELLGVLMKKKFFMSAPHLFLVSHANFRMTREEKNGQKERERESERLFVKYYLCSMTRHNLLQNVKINFYVPHRPPQQPKSKMKFYLK